MQPWWGVPEVRPESVVQFLATCGILSLGGSALSPRTRLVERPPCFPRPVKGVLGARRTVLSILGIGDQSLAN